MKAEKLPFADGEFDARDRDRGARARARPGAHGRRDGARGARRGPARLGAARAAVARAEHGPRRLPARTSATPPGTSTTGPSAAFVALLGRHGEVVEARSPFPWTMLLVRRVSRPRERPSGYGRGARILSIGIASTGRRHVRVLLGRLLRARRRRLQGDRAAVVGAVRDRLGDLPADRAAALAHDRRPPRARPRGRPPAAHAAADPGGLRARASWSSRWCCAGRSRTTCSTARRRSTGSSSSPCSPTRRATSRAAGWPGTSGSRSTAGSCSWRRAARLLFALAVAVGIARGPDRRSRSAWRRRRSSRSSSCRGRSRAGRPRGERAARRRGRRSGSARGGRFARRRAGDHGRRADAAQRRRADRRRDGRATPRWPASSSTCC